MISQGNSQLFFDLLWGMTEKELKARYKHTVFGFLWVFINPLLQMLVIGFVFRFFIKEPIDNYFFYLFTGPLVWNFFTLSLTKATPAIVNERSLIKKAKFPHSVIPLSIIISNAINMLLALVLLLIPTLFLHLFTFAKIPALFAGLALLLGFTSGFSLLTSAVNVRFRDINFFVQAILIIWFYATPIVYSIVSIPYRYIWLWRLNPMTSSVQFLQHAFVGAPLPGPAMLSANVVVTIIVLFLGVWLFRRESKYFDDWV